MSNIILFPEVRVPLEITPKRDLVSVRRMSRTFRPSRLDNYVARVYPTSKASLNAKTSAAMT